MKLIVLFVLVGVLPMTVGAYLNYRSTAQALEDASRSKLEATLTQKKGQIESWFGERRADITVLASFPEVRDAAEQYELAFDDGGPQGARYQAVQQKFDPLLRGIKEGYGYYDLFLISPSGTVHYTVAHEADFGSDLVKGSYKDTALAKVFRRARSGEVALSDFESYAPSNGDPASFIAAPVKRGNEVVAVLALQMPLGTIDDIMQERTGLGETGETYLVGSDFKMRSDSRFSKKSTVLEQEVRTQGTEAALGGKAGVGKIADYRGVPVWSAYAPLDVHGLSWAILAEIDQEEAEGPLVGIKQRMAIALVIIAFLVAAVGYVFSRTITRPVEKLRALLDKVARGDLSERPDIDSKDEVGQMAVSISQMVDNVAEMLESIQASSRTLATSSQEIAANSQDLSNRTQEQAAALEETSSTIEELSATIKGNADRAERANAMATKTAGLAQGGGSVVRNAARAMEEVTTTSKQVAEIVGMVDEIAFQTNLLALNAAVEAARAGEQGKGFAVVAQEVRTLAGRSADAAKEINALIKNSIAKIDDTSRFVSDSGRTLEGIIEAVRAVESVVSEISLASREQADAIQQVNVAVTQMDQVVQQNAALVEESSASAENLAREAGDLRQLTTAFKLRTDAVDLAPERRRPVRSLAPAGGLAGHPMDEFF
ncbi:MAG: HAMP domain-containing protein [Polyangiaceae bacterium]|nr:HAMP domain-containing protein [Polyangiaceae bacterium]